jgi:hypothetical protein
MMNPMLFIGTCQQRKERAEEKRARMGSSPAQIFSLPEGSLWGYIGKKFSLPWFGGSQTAGERKEGGSFMKPELAETAWAREMKKKVEEEMARREMETILYWKGEVDKILVKRPESLATFQIEVRNLLQRMLNRIRVLKTSLPG